MSPQTEALLEALTVARKFEGCFLRPYLCPAHVPSIGYGTTRYENGLRVSLIDPPITQARAEQLLGWEMRHCYDNVMVLCQMYGWSPEAIAAIMDFCYNLGSGNLRASTLRKRILDGDTVGAQRELMKWVHGGGRVLPGLVRRRAVESALLQK